MTVAVAAFGVEYIKDWSNMQRPEDDTEPSNANANGPSAQARHPTTTSNARPEPSTTSAARPEPSGASASASRHARDWFGVPRPVKRVFDAFPLITYAPNEAPSRSRSTQDLPSLYIFTTTERAGPSSRSRRPSFNPGCLKWQTYLLFNGVRFHTVPSNNHASPTGVLPFLVLPSSPAVKHGDANTLSTPAVQQQQQQQQQTQRIIPSNKIQAWIRDQSVTNISEPSDLRYEAFLSLLDHRIRHAWLCNLYLDPAHSSLRRDLYINPATTTGIVREILSYQLESAAQNEVLKAGPGGGGGGGANLDEIFVEAEEAFEALATLLGADEWFFGADGPSLFDAAVFAYTHPLLDENMGWRQQRLGECVRRAGIGGRGRGKAEGGGGGGGGTGNLVGHCERILEMYYS